MTGWKRILLATALLVAGIAGSAAAQTLRIGLAEDPDILDPTLARTFVGRIVFAAMCDKLVDITPQLKFVPQLATAWHYTDDNKALVMTLRQGVKFQDGTPFDAAAAKFSIERHLHLPGSNRKGEISAVKDVQIVDDHTIKLVLSTPFSPLLAALSDRAGMMVSPTAAKAEGDKFGAHPVCVGPFKFTERVPQDRIVLERDPNYWNKAAIHFDKIVFLPIPDSTVRLANLESGGLDIIERVAATDIAAVKKNPKLAFSEITEIGYQGITFNSHNGPRSQSAIGDPKIREAFDLAIDRNALNQVVFNGLFTPGNQWVAPNNPYYDKDLPVPGRDVAKAKALLAAAKMPHPKVELMVPNSPENMQAAQVVQSMVSEAGFDVSLRATEFATSLSLASKGDFEAYLIGWSGRADPDGNIYNFVSCKAPPALNPGHYCDPAVDAALNAARETNDPAARSAQYKIVADHVLKDRPLIYLWHRKWLWAMTKKLHGFVPYPDGLIRPAGLKFE